MPLSADCPCGRSQLFTFESNDKIVVDRKTFDRVFLLVRRSVDELANTRHREIFLECLDTCLTESKFLDDARCFQASLLLDAYYEYVPASLALLNDKLEEAFKLMQAVEHD
ncbi:hypothetical protein QUA56_22935 [Microcoleus sp. N3A4]|uniref:hypothetical protein n=1 Tax=Microcoleus sp. N3A4 TaxID=3055379 RepID=UPI002FCE7E93